MIKISGCQGFGSQKNHNVHFGHLPKKSLIQGRGNPGFMKCDFVCSRKIRLKIACCNPCLKVPNKLTSRDLETFYQDA